MRTSLIVASFGAAVAALSAGIASASAEPVASAYPYCLMGRGGGSTTCYFKSRAECGNGCINNPSYVGEVRARALLAGVGMTSGSARALASAKDIRNAPTAVGVARIDRAARASAAGGEGFEGWPTGYLVDRFGDRQAQGR